MPKVFYICEITKQVVSASECDPDTQVLVGTRPFKKVGEHITQSGFYGFTYVPLPWEVSSVSILESGDIHAFVIKSTLLDDEYDALIESPMAAISPDSFEGDVEKFRAFLKGLGVSNGRINTMIQNWQNQGGDRNV